MSSTRHGISRKLGFAIFVTVIALIYVAQDVLIPIVLATLVSFLLVRPVRFLEQRRIPTPLAALLAVLLLASGIVAASWFVAGQVTGVLHDLPQYRQNIRARMAAIHGSDAGTAITGLKEELSALSKPQPEAEPLRGRRAAATEPLLVKVDEPGTLGALVDMIAAVMHPIAVTGVVVLFSIFMLIQREDLFQRLLTLSGSMAWRGRETLTAHALSDIAARISRYLLMQSLMNLTTGVLAACALAALGLPNALLWGFLAALLRYVPYLGMIIAVGLIALFALGTSPDWGLPLTVLAALLAIEALISGVAEPLCYGHGTGLSSLAILVAATFWTWLWGPIGLFMSVPMTVCLTVVGRYVPSLDFLHTLLSDRHSFTSTDVPVPAKVEAKKTPRPASA
jgi:predicted PurR-regulated permease PerM